jgi:hypothetical protein
MTIGYTNLHIYLREAFRLLIMPNAMTLQTRGITHKDIVLEVLKHSNLILAE